MRFRIMRGFNSIVSAPGIEVTTARLIADGSTYDLAVDRGVIFIKHTDLAELKSDTNLLQCVMEVNGSEYPCDVMLNPKTPSRR